MFEFKIPEIGENIASGTVVSILVKVGDTVKKDQDLLELETDKASLPIPSPCDGIIKEILIKEGDEIKIGQLVMNIESGASSTPEQPKPAAETPTAAPEAQAASTPEPVQTQTQAVSTPEEPQVDPSSIHLVVLGGGPGGYAAAFLAADLGLQVSLVDLDKNPGGVCLYRGCIPSKALLHAAKVLSEAREASHFGLTFDEPKIDLDKLRNWKNGVVERLTSGLGQMSKQRKINFIQGRGSFIDSNTLKIEKPDGTEENLAFDKAILATGSRPIALPFAPNSKRILDSTTALDITNIPKSMLLVGGGYIGLELGTAYAEFGTEVSVVEMLPQLMTGADRDLARVLEDRLKKIMKTIMVDTKVTAMDEVDGAIKVSFEDKDGKAFSETYEEILVAIGRKPNSENIGLENTNVVVTDRGFIKVNDQLQTADPSIYAIGDLTGNPMLAHKASHEGRTAAEAIAGHKVAFEPAAIPAVVFTDPEMAWAGVTQMEAKAQGLDVVVTKFPWGASGRAITLDRTDGVTKLIVDRKTERILGIGIAGPHAGELIAEGVLAIEMGATVEDLKLTIHPHPTLSETLMEAAEVFFGQSTHVYKPKKK